LERERFDPTREEGLNDQICNSTESFISIRNLKNYFTFLEDAFIAETFNFDNVGIAFANATEWKTLLPRELKDQLNLI
jgi:hypothetical protein